MNSEIIQIAVEDIKTPNDAFFDKDYLKEIIESINNNGIKFPLIVYRNGDKFELISGYMIYKAAIYSGLTYVPVIIKNRHNKTYEYNERNMVNVMDESEKYKLIIENGFYDLYDIALKKGLSKYAIDCRIKMSELLNENIQKSILNGELTERHARLLLKIDDEKIRNDVYNAIISQYLTVRETSSLIKKLEAEKEENLQNANNVNELDINDENDYIYDGRYSDNNDQENNISSGKFITVEYLDDYEEKTEKDHVQNVIDRIKQELAEENIILDENQNNDGLSLNIRILKEKNS